jgi:5-formyltetrahydrofolate cyclo-ligase
MIYPQVEQFMDSANLRKERNRVLQRVQVALDALSDRIHAQNSFKVAKKLIETPEFKRVEALGIFVGFGGEVDTIHLMEAALGLGKLVAAPSINTKERTLIWREITDPDTQIDLGPLGIPEPKPTCRQANLAALEVVTVPALAWDEQGRRLAYWPGYFERTLRMMPRAFKVGLSFDLQVVEDLSNLTGPTMLNALITEDQVRRFGMETPSPERRIPGGPVGYKGQTH